MKYLICCIPLLALLDPACAQAPLGAVTTIQVGPTVLHSGIKRFGINLGQQNYYDSDQLMKNLIYPNPGFEGLIYQSTIRCASGTATSCVDENPNTSWTADFWDGATFEVFYGAASGRTGTVVTSTAPGTTTGIVLNFDSPGVAPANGDYLIVRKTAPGNGVAGWWPTTTNGAAISTEFSDVPPGTLGKQAVNLIALSAGQSAVLTSYFDTLAGHSFVQLNGTYQLSFKAKGLAGQGLNPNASSFSPSVSVSVRRNSNSFLSTTVPLSGSWATYNLSFTAAEAGAIGSAQVQFSTVGLDSFLLDEVSLVQTDGDPSNTTQFRDAVVTALRSYNPGVLRYWGYQLGNPLDNLLTPMFGRQRAGYSSFAADESQINYGLHDFLELCQAVGADPWFVVPTTFSVAEASNLIDYLAGSTQTVYGAKRAALGQAAPWTTVFGTIHLEFGNEAWNSTFKGASIEYSQPYGNRAQAMFAAMRSNPSYAASRFDLIIGGQAVWPSRNQDIQNACNNNDSFSVAPYQMGTVNTYATNEDLFGPTYAEPEAFVTPTGVGETVTGMMYQNQQMIQSSTHPTPLVVYEVNMGTTAGAIPQNVLNSYASSLGAGLAVADNMLQEMRQFGIATQSIWQLGQYEFTGSNGELVMLWGAVVDMGVTNLRRPQFLAAQLGNQAIFPGGNMLQTAHSGADPTWNQAMENGVQLSGAHYLQSFAFSRGANRSVIVFNLHRTSPLPVMFSGPEGPRGQVQMRQLTSANPTDTNETANVVQVSETRLSLGLTPLMLPPNSMTVLSWSQVLQ